MGYELMDRKRNILIREMVELTVDGDVTVIPPGEEMVYEITPWRKAMNRILWGYGLTSITWGKSVTTIGDNAFANCYALETVAVPENVVAIGNWTFSGCEALADITIPAAVTSLGTSVFSGCSKLKFAEFNTAGRTPHAPHVGAVTTIPPDAFSSLTANAAIETAIEFLFSKS